MSDEESKHNRYGLGQGMFRRSARGQAAHTAAMSGESGKAASGSSKSRAHDGGPLGDQSGRRRGAGAAGEGSNRSDRGE